MTGDIFLQVADRDVDFSQHLFAEKFQFPLGQTSRFGVEFEYIATFKQEPLMLHIQTFKIIRLGVALFLLGLLFCSTSIGHAQNRLITSSQKTNRLVKPILGQEPPLKINPNLYFNPAQLQAEILKIQLLRQLNWEQQIQERLLGTSPYPQQGIGVQPIDKLKKLKELKPSITSSKTKLPLIEAKPQPSVGKSTRIKNPYYKK